MNRFECAEGLERVQHELEWKLASHPVTFMYILAVLFDEVSILLSHVEAVNRIRCVEGQDASSANEVSVKRVCTF